MHKPNYLMRNAEWADAIPASLASPAWRCQVARRLAQAEWLFRRKSDGRYLATIAYQHKLSPLVPLSSAQTHSLRQILSSKSRNAETLPLDNLWRILAMLGIKSDYGRTHGIEPIAEPISLTFAGRDRFRRPLWLLPSAAKAWQAMRTAAGSDGVHLDAISGFRSHEHQCRIFQRKLAQGATINKILAVNAAPGFSEHNGGFALDIGTANEAPNEATFERTAAFDWLCRRAALFGFYLSHPRDNPHGIVYEPWHWAHRAR